MVVGALRLLRPAKLVHDRTAVAVLPFVVREGSPEASYLADGMTDGLIADLAQIASLKIIPRSSSALAEKASTSLSEIAKELGVAVGLPPNRSAPPIAARQSPLRGAGAAHFGR